MYRLFRFLFSWPTWASMLNFVFALLQHPASQPLDTGPLDLRLQERRVFPQRRQRARQFRQRLVERLDRRPELRLAVGGA